VWHGGGKSNHESHESHESAERKASNDGDPAQRRKAYAIIGACFEVYNDKGCGFLEPVYQECLEIELQLRGIPFVAQAELKLSYKGRTLKKTYQPDFACFDKVIVEIKAVSELTDEHRSQVHNYLKATGYRLGLLVNFGAHGELLYERIVR